jgi:hypothetical protein
MAAKCTWKAPRMRGITTVEGGREQVVNGRWRTNARLANAASSCSWMGPAHDAAPSHVGRHGGGAGGSHGIRSGSRRSLPRCELPRSLSSTYQTRTCAHGRRPRIRIQSRHSWRMVEPSVPEEMLARMEKALERAAKVLGEIQELALRLRLNAQKGFPTGPQTGVAQRGREVAGSRRAPASDLAAGRRATLRSDAPAPRRGGPPERERGPGARRSPRPPIPEGDVSPSEQRILDA